MLQRSSGKYWRIQRDTSEPRVFHICSFETQEVPERNHICWDLNQYAGKSKWKRGEKMENDAATQVLHLKVFGFS